MRFSAIAQLLLAASFARANDNLDDDAASSVIESVVESATTSSVPKATFIPTTLKAPFLEQFIDGWESRWKVSHAKKLNDKSSEEEWAFVGTWSVEEPTVLKGMNGDKGLVLKDKAAHHAISSKFTKPIDPKGKDLVVQYEVKLQNGLECGGAYMKLLQDNKQLGKEEFSNASPYVIMFGPDKCGATNKVHFIFKHKNPKTGEYEEKHLKSPPMARLVRTTTLYTLIVHPDQTFEIKIDGESVKKGSLLEDFTPAVNPDKEIDDDNDTKPEDWVDEARIPDPEATKPEDWDEDAPYEIEDTEATKPADWLEDEPMSIPDPEAEKPEDWDDEEDGDWIPPTVPNPKCDEVSGCGPWVRPNKRNPAYKGKWTAPYIDNPAYKGVWKPRKIPNPNYFEDLTPANFEPIGAIGFELWTMQNDILFDNIYIGHSVEDAEALQKESFDLKIAAEKAEEDLSRPKIEEADKPDTHEPSEFRKDPFAYIAKRVQFFMTVARYDPIEAVKLVPEVPGALVVAILITVLAFIQSAANTPAPAPVKKGKEAAKDVKDTAASAVATGAEKTKAEATKRTTRSSS